MASSSRAEPNAERHQAATQRQCEEHGPFDALPLYQGQGATVWSRCPACMAKNEAFRVQQQQAQEQQRQSYRQAQRLLECGLRGRFRSATFGTFNATSRCQAAVVRACQQYVSELERGVWKGLWLIGPPGTGKSHLGAAIVRATIEARDMAAAVATPREIVRNLRSTWRRDADETEEGVIDAYSAMPLLVLDEVGVGFGTDGELVQLFDVIDRRYQLGLPVVVISNLAAPELRTAVGDRIFDRLREGAKVLVCDWASYRGRAPE